MVDAADLKSAGREAVPVRVRPWAPAPHGGASMLITTEPHSETLRVHKLEIWRGERCLFRDLSFRAVAGEVIHLKGPNGSGKTTLLRTLAGLTLADEGEIHWFGRRYRGRVGPEARARFRFVGHHDALKGGLDVRENLRALNAL